MKCFLSLMLVCLSFGLTAQTIDSSFYKSMKWRMIGPHRGGRTVGACGVKQQPNVFYIGVNNGGVWKTNDFGRTWKAIFDEQYSGSVGDVAVAPTNPEVIYVASGEGLHRPDLSVGNGMYKSIDGGSTWSHLGLDSVQQIGGLAIDPQNENKVFVAVLGHPYGPNAERGVYRTTDGGNSWQKVLYVDENTGAIQVTIDPKNSNIIYADLWENRLAPWENGEWSGKGSGLYKSIDGGTTWKKLTAGLPTTEQGLGRIGFTIAPSDANRMYATVDAGEYGGIYRSDDAGETWRKMTGDERFWGRGSDFAEMKVDPKNPDIVYTADVVVWKSTDGAQTFDAFKGAPGGDDYHRMWINPDNPAIILIASDQGAIVTVNGGETFSSWYNQPTAQFYHVSTDNAFPYNVYGGQQESGSVGIASRGNDGQITFREWHPVGAQEYGYVAADPLDPNIIYGGKITRFDKRTGQTQDISPEIVSTGDYRFIRTAPVLFSPVDKKTLFYAGNVLFKTLNGGTSWSVISPDLSRTQEQIAADIPANIGIYRSDAIKQMPRRGVIYTVAPSPKDINTIWCGTDDGLIHITMNGGKTWKNVTPRGVTAWSKISMIDAGQFDANTAYAAVNRIRLDDMKPHIYKTTDGGITWKEIVNGLPQDPINVVREDPYRKGLLFAGSERAVYFSLDAGENWQSLRLNMPATSIRDLVIKNADIVVGTHGRSFWILDDITPLRQLNISIAAQPAIFYKPQDAYRVRWNMWTDTPLPAEEPAGDNPPDGAIINYHLNQATDDVVLEIFDKNNKLVRRYTNYDTLYKIPTVNIPHSWIRPQQIISAAKGAHRFIWDLHYQPLNVPASYPISAIPGNTAPNYTSPWVMPGEYRLKMRVEGKYLTQKLIVKHDPRVKTSLADLQLQHDLSLLCYKRRGELAKLIIFTDFLQGVLREGAANTDRQTAMKFKEYSKEIYDLQNSKTGSKNETLSGLLQKFAALQDALQDSDMPPTLQMINGVKKADAAFKKLEHTIYEIKEAVHVGEDD
ncbi:hypothetical protein BH09BAC2_BH09BAC2_13910 [soil metagenome]